VPLRQARRRGSNFKLPCDSLLEDRNRGEFPDTATKLTTEQADKLEARGNRYLYEINSRWRGALSNERPYRDLGNVVANYPFERSLRFLASQRIPATETIRV
jgi:hypothetical protein